MQSGFAAVAGVEGGREWFHPSQSRDANEPHPSGPERSVRHTGAPEAPKMPRQTRLCCVATWPPSAELPLPRVAVLPPGAWSAQSTAGEPVEEAQALGP